MRDTGNQAKYEQLLDDAGFEIRNDDDKEHNDNESLDEVSLTWRSQDVFRDSNKGKPLLHVEFVRTRGATVTRTGKRNPASWHLVDLNSHVDTIRDTDDLLFVCSDWHRFIDARHDIVNK